MLARVLALATLSISCAYAQLATVQQAFTDAKIVPDVLPSFNPTGLLNVVFLDTSTGAFNEVTPGLPLTRAQTAVRPQFIFASNDTSLNGKTFVLAMVDPDAPTPQTPTAGQIRHLLAPDIRAIGDVTTGAVLVNNTAAISNFLRPTPPAGSDPHRYIQLLFVQPRNFDRIASRFVNASTPINNFNISAFAAQVGLGAPIAGNFFLTGPDASSV